MVNYDANGEQMELLTGLLRKNVSKTVYMAMIPIRIIVCTSIYAIHVLTCDTSIRPFIATFVFQKIASTVLRYAPQDLKNVRS
jgi:hypothetical protein